MDFTTEWSELRKQYQEFLGPGNRVKSPKTVTFSGERAEFDLEAMRNLRRTRELELARYSYQKSLNGSENITPPVSRTTSDRPSYPSAIIESCNTDSIEFKSKRPSAEAEEDSMHLSPVISSNATLSEADTFRSPSLSQTLVQSQGPGISPVPDIKLLSQLTTNPFEVKVSDRSHSSSKDGLNSPPLLRQDQSQPQSLSISSGRPSMSSSQLGSKRLSSPTNLAPSIPEVREAATPQFDKNVPSLRVSQFESIGDKQQISEVRKWREEFLSLQGNQLSRPTSDKGEILADRSGPSLNGSERSLKTEAQRYNDHHPFSPLDESSISVLSSQSSSRVKPNTQPQSLLPEREGSLPQYRDTSMHSSPQSDQVKAFLRMNDPRPVSVASNEPIISTPSIGQLQMMKTGELLTPPIDPLRFDDGKEELSPMSSLRFSDQYSKRAHLTEEIYQSQVYESPKLESAGLLMDKVDRLILWRSREFLSFAFQALKVSESSEDFWEENEEKTGRAGRFYMFRLRLKVLEGWQQAKRMYEKKKSASEFRAKNVFLRLHQYFSGFMKVCRAHKLWIEEVQTEFAHRHLE